MVTLGHTLSVLRTNFISHLSISHPCTHNPMAPDQLFLHNYSLFSPPPETKNRKALTLHVYQIINVAVEHSYFCLLVLSSMCPYH